MKKYKVDEWVYYYAMPDSDYEPFANERIRALVLSTLSKKDFYDYRIFIEKTQKIKKVREHHLFPVS